MTDNIKITYCLFEEGSQYNFRSNAGTNVTMRYNRFDRGNYGYVSDPTQSIILTNPGQAGNAKHDPKYGAGNFKANRNTNFTFTENYGLDNYGSFVWMDFSNEGSFIENNYGKNTFDLCTLLAGKKH